MTKQLLGDSLVDDMEHWTCPGCHADLRGEPIPEKYFVHNVPENPDWDPERNPSCEKQKADWGRCHCLPYGDKPPGERFFSQIIGIEIRGVYDGVLFWQCPACGGQWHRWTSPDMRARAAQHMTNPIVVTR